MTVGEIPYAGIHEPRGLPEAVADDHVVVDVETGGSRRRSAVVVVGDGQLRTTHFTLPMSNQDRCG